jgi:hypothetical protein
VLSQIEFDVEIKKVRKGFIASCPSIGTKGQGRTEEEAIEELKDHTWRLLFFTFPARSNNN